MPTMPRKNITMDIPTEVKQAIDIVEKLEDTIDKLVGLTIAEAIDNLGRSQSHITLDSTTTALIIADVIKDVDSAFSTVTGNEKLASDGLRKMVKGKVLTILGRSEALAGVIKSLTQIPPYKNN